MGDDTSSPLKTHSDLVSAVTAVDINGYTWFMQPGKAPELAFAKDGVNPELRALLASAHILYKVAADTKNMFDTLIAIMEDKGLDAPALTIITYQAALHTAMRCATEGVEKVLVEHKKR